MSQLILEKVGGPRGAPMGRPNILPEDPTKEIKLEIGRMRMVDHDYDVGGAYWGGGPSKAGVMYAAWGFDDEHMVQVFVRAPSKFQAELKVEELVPGARF